MRLNTFCDVLKVYTCIGEWYLSTSFFDGPPTCEPLNKYQDAFCPDDSFTKFYYAIESFNSTIQKWYEFAPDSEMFDCFGGYKGNWMDFYKYEDCK